MRCACSFLVGYIARAGIGVEVPDEVLTGCGGLWCIDFCLEVRHRKQPGVDLDAADDAFEFFPAWIASPRCSVEIGRLPNHNRRYRGVLVGPVWILDRL